MQCDRMVTRSRARIDLGSLVVFICLVAGACATARNDRPPGPPFRRMEVPALPALGAAFHSSGPSEYDELTRSGSTNPAYPVSVQGVRFVVAVSRSDGTVVYV